MNQSQEGAESILNYAKPTEPVNLTLWQTCKAHPLPAVMAVLFLTALVAAIFWTVSSNNPRNTPKKIATEAIKTKANDDVLGDFIAELERKKTKLPKDYP